MGIPLWPIMVPSSGSPASLAGQTRSGSNMVQTWLSAWELHSILHGVMEQKPATVCSETLHGFAAAKQRLCQYWRCGKMFELDVIICGQSPVNVESILFPLKCMNIM